MSWALAAMFILTMVSGTAVVLTRDPTRQSVVLSGNGLVLAVLFLLLQAPDVAFSEIAVGMVLVPTMFLSVLASVRSHRLRRRSERK